jgi:hypothetical protein
VGKGGETEWGPCLGREGQWGRESGGEAGNTCITGAGCKIEECGGPQQQCRAQQCERRGHTRRLWLGPCALKLLVSSSAPLALS